MSFCTGVSTRNLHAIGMLLLLSLLLDRVPACRGFVPAFKQPGFKSRLFSAPPTENAVVSSSQTEMAQAQAIAKARAFNNFDDFAMNALFVNIDENPNPKKCKLKEPLPADLPRGCLLRIGPNGATQEDGFLDGDGMVHCITLPPDGQDVMYSATYVDTKGRKLENSLGNGSTFAGTLGAAPKGLPMLYNLFRNGVTFGTLDVQKDTCNTALAVSGSRVLALMEQSPPSEICIEKDGSLKTLESFARLDGAVPNAPINGGSMGAHGRTDLDTQERIHVSYNSVDRPYVRVDTFSKNWKLKSSVGVDVPTPVMVHDLTITKNYVVILDFPLTIRPIRMFLEDKFPVEYEPTNGSRIGLTTRGKDEETMWFDVENGVVLHAGNAYEREDGMVVVHAFKSFPKGDASYILDYCPAFLYEWILDPVTGKTVEERCLNPNVCVEFPHVVDRASGQTAANIYGLVTTKMGIPLKEFKTPGNAVLLDGVVEFDLENNAQGEVKSRFDLKDGWHFVSEPTIVTKTSGSGQYVLLIATYVPPNIESQGENHVSVARDQKSLKTKLLILDGDCIANGPVTSIDLPRYVNYGLHSLFLDWDVMQ
mmetsp:Transcript_16404/g.41129  ORF Transcript_16404/g.41129 Transcript_16404/m.41129 type:complete len:593 (+) Transcript_16404:63-1841(+)